MTLPLFTYAQRVQIGVYAGESKNTKLLNNRSVNPYSTAEYGSDFNLCYGAQLKLKLGRHWQTGVLLEAKEVSTIVEGTNIFNTKVKNEYAIGSPALSVKGLINDRERYGSFAFLYGVTAGYTVGLAGNYPLGGSKSNAFGPESIHGFSAGVLAGIEFYLFDRISIGLTGQAEYLYYSSGHGSAFPYIAFPAVFGINYNVFD